MEAKTANPEYYDRLGIQDPLSEGAEGSLVEISPEWSILAGGGAVDEKGIFTAGMVPGVFTATVQAATWRASGQTASSAAPAWSRPAPNSAST